MTHSCDALVVGAGGFLGGHLVRSLLDQGLTVRAVDIRPTSAWNQVHDRAVNTTSDLSQVDSAMAAVSGSTTVYHLASPLASGSRAQRMLGVLLDTHLLLAARETGVDRFLFTSSAGTATTAENSTEGDDRCWRDLFTERMARHFLEDFGVQTRIARLGTVFGEHDGGVAEVTVATTVARRIAAAALAGEHVVAVPFAADDVAAGIYVEDAVLGMQLVTHGTADCRPYDVVDPAPTTVGAVTDSLLRAAKTTIVPIYTSERAAPTVQGDRDALREQVDWEPEIPQDVALERLYRWTTDELRRTKALPPSLSDWLAARRRGEARPSTPGGVGRHRYANAG